MKRVIYVTAILMATVFTASAQQAPRRTYINFNYVSSKMDNEMGLRLKSDYGAALSIGHTYYLHRKPLWGMVRFGLDWTIFDLNFSKYSTEYQVSGEGDQSTEKINFYKAEAGMHLGPSVTVTPVKGLSVSGYYRYAPTYSAYFKDDLEAVLSDTKGQFAQKDAATLDNVSPDYLDEITKRYKGGYGSYQVLGVSVFYKFISIGVEKRWGSTSLKYGEAEDGSVRKVKLKTSGPRVYLGVRF
ncbi:MAG: hypothetical protein LBN24_12790 [Mediterranea sp.]|jgi:hypothetical protein|nr:hypothetical protein [Mediterranea sp.]